MGHRFRGRSRTLALAAAVTIGTTGVAGVPAAHAQERQVPQLPHVAEAAQLVDAIAGAIEVPEPPKLPNAPVLPVLPSVQLSELPDVHAPAPPQLPELPVPAPAPAPFAGAAQPPVETPAGPPVEAPVETAARAVDPNYVWRTGLPARVLAGKPFAEKVLHRVPGSFHDAPAIPAESDAARERGVSLYGPGTPVYVGDSMCTVAVAGYDESGRKVAITAGHCGAPGTPVASADSPQVGDSGTVVATNPELDYSVIELGSNSEVSRTYNGVTINTVGGAPQRPGTVVCKKGVASGHTCGMTFHEWDRNNISQVCAMYGDSGAPLVAGDRLVGLVTGGFFPPEVNLACHTPLQGALHAPTVSTRMDAVMSDIEGRDAPGRGFTLPE
ncbi:S1 family peptidase [Corynebacterium timonense]|uniref:Trypsin n=1 Tax=Corynebacterium timonense TaxID=441500 RepID=A0A1H1RIP3_9CORY|nr:S1 family peptidase [Corynebacterium timonense]SDS35604.1 hypothetical protein SAMN04488539_1510 [Corynebacterium timonense]